MFAPRRGPHQTPGNVLRGWKVKGVRKCSLGSSSAHPASLGYHLCLTCFSFPLISTFLLVVIGSEPTFTSTQTHFPSFSVPAKWGPCTLPPVHPLRSSPSRLLLKVISFNHFFKKVFFFFSPRAVQGHRSHQCCFLTQRPFNQAEVHFATGLCRPPFLPGAQGWSQWPQSEESHSCQSFRGGIGDLHQFTGI